MSRRASIALSLLVVAIPAAVRANPLDAFGFGAEAVARGGAMTALSTGFAANYYNPAGLADNDALRLELGYAFTESSLAINGGDLDVDPSRGLQGGLVLPGRLFEHRVGISLGLFLPDALISRVRSLPQAQPRFVLFDNRPQRLVISTSAAVEIIDGLFLGAGLTYLSSTKGTLGLVGTVNVGAPERTQLFSSVDVTFDATRYPTVGLLYQPTERWRFGLVYRHEFILDLDLAVDVHGKLTLGEEDLVLVENGAFLVESLNHNLFSPRQLAAGAAYQGDGFSVAFDLTWLDWSRFLAPVSAIDLALDLGDLDFKVPVPDRPLDPGFVDILVPRIGGEVTVLDDDPLGLVVRAGYFYEPSPAPAQPGATNYVDGTKHGLAVGLGLSVHAFPSVFPHPLTLDVAMQLILMEAVVVEKQAPADPVGDYRADGHLLGGAATLGLAL